MKLEEFARLILFGTTLESKLEKCSQSVLEISPQVISPIEIPIFPGQPSFLVTTGKSSECLFLE